ncbi:MAG: hypothetical protein AAGG11_07205 [Pseudomonadota bacterium]
MRQAVLSGLVCCAILPVPGIGAGVPGMPEPPSTEVLAALRALRVELVPTPPAPIFKLRYAGPITRPFGPLCYGFAGYSETCIRLSEPWLTPAAVVELYAPGGVPLDLLAGYQLRVRFPSWTKKVFMPEHIQPSQSVPSP